jgi:hypothetical protein
VVQPPSLAKITSVKEKVGEIAEGSDVKKAVVKSKVKEGGDIEVYSSHGHNLEFDVTFVRAT